MQTIKVRDEFRQLTGIWEKKVHHLIKNTFDPHIQQH